MTPTFIDATYGRAYATLGPPVVPLPSCIIGDLLLAMAIWDSSPVGGLPDPPAGWTRIGRDGTGANDPLRHQFYARLATGGDPPIVSLPAGGGGNLGYLAYSSYRGALFPFMSLGDWIEGTTTGALPGAQVAQMPALVLPRSSALIGAVNLFSGASGGGGEFGSMGPAGWTQDWVGGSSYSPYTNVMWVHSDSELSGSESFEATSIVGTTRLKFWGQILAVGGGSAARERWM